MFGKIPCSGRIACMAVMCILIPSVAAGVDVEPYAYADAGYGVPDGMGGWNWPGYDWDEGSASVSAEYLTTTGTFAGSAGRADSPIDPDHPEIGQVGAQGKLICQPDRPERKYYGWATIMVPFVVTSDTLPDGTSVEFDLAVEFSGSFWADEADYSPSTIKSRAYGYVGVYDESALEVYLGGGVPAPLGGSSMDGSAGCNPAGIFPSPWDAGDWDNASWTVAMDDGNHCNMTKSNDLGFAADVGGVYGIVMDLWVEGWTAQNDDDPAAIRAEVDAMNTLDYEITWTDDVGLEMVPEPASLGLLAAGGLALIRKRRGM